MQAGSTKKAMVTLLGLAHIVAIRSLFLHLLLHTKYLAAASEARCVQNAECRMQSPAMVVVACVPAHGDLVCQWSVTSFFGAGICDVPLLRETAGGACPWWYWLGWKGAFFFWAVLCDWVRLAGPLRSPVVEGSQANGGLGRWLAWRWQTADGSVLFLGWKGRHCGDVCLLSQLLTRLVLLVEDITCEAFPLLFYFGCLAPSVWLLCSSRK